MVRDGILNQRIDAMRKFVFLIDRGFIRILAIVFCFFFFAVSCDKEERVHEPKVVTIEATFLRPSAEGARSEELAQYIEEDGIKATWSSDDVIDVYDMDGQAHEFIVKAINEDGSASFSGSVSLEAGDKLTAVLRNKVTSSASYDPASHSLTVDLSRQDGTLEDACSSTLAYASATYDGDEPLRFAFEQKTSILKFVLKLPPDRSEDRLCGFSLSCGMPGTRSSFNSLTIDVLTGELSFGSQGAGSQEGDVTMPEGCSVKPSDGWVTLYLSVCPSALRNSVIQCVSLSDADERYIWRVAGTGALTPESGMMYCLTRQSCGTARTGEIWMDDSAHIVNDVMIPANRTGFPQVTSASKNLWGFEYECRVLQIEEKDFSGAYTLNGDIRSSETVPDVSAASADVAGTYAVRGGTRKGYYYDAAWVKPFANSSVSTTIDIEYLDGRSDNLKLSGLYPGLAMPGEVRLSREEKSISLCLRIENKAYLMTSGSYAGEYLAFQPQLTNAKTGRYELGVANAGIFDYQGTVTYGSGDLSVNFDRKQTCTEYPAYQVMGIMVNRYAAAGNGSTSDEWLIRSTANTYYASGPDISGSAYLWVVQGNFSLTKAAGRTPGAGITVPGYNAIN